MDVPLHLIFGAMIQKMGMNKFPRWLFIIPVIMSHYYVDKLNFWDHFPMPFEINFVGVDFAQLIITLSLGAIVFVFLRKYWAGMVLSIVPWDICYFSHHLGVYFGREWGRIEGMPYHQWFQAQINHEPITTIFTSIFIIFIVYLIASRVPRTQEAAKPVPGSFKVLPNLLNPINKLIPSSSYIGLSRPEPLPEAQESK